MFCFLHFVFCCAQEKARGALGHDSPGKKKATRKGGGSADKFKVRHEYNDIDLIAILFVVFSCIVVRILYVVEF